MEYSNLKVMLASNGQYYIGRSGVNGSSYSRESCYYLSKSKAEKDLSDFMDINADSGFVVRNCPENNSRYDSGDLPDIR